MPLFECLITENTRVRFRVLVRAQGHADARKKARDNKGVVERQLVRDYGVERNLYTSPSLTTKEDFLKELENSETNNGIW